MRLSLRLRMALLFAGLTVAALAALGAGLWLGYRRLGHAEALDGFVQAGVVSGFALLGLVAWVWYLVDSHVARPVDVLAGALRARVHSDVTGGLDPGVGVWLGDLAPAATAAAQTLSDTRNALAAAVARETTRLTGEKSRLEAVLADVGVGVILCSGDHMLAFYNGQAVDLMGVGMATPGLGRSLFDHLREGPVRLAHDRLIATGDAEAASDLLCATLTGGRVLSARMRLMGAGNGSAPGYVLILRDVTADHAAHTRREALLTEVFDRLRRPAANLTTLLAAIPEGAAGSAKLDAALREEVAGLSAAVTELSQRHDAGRGDWSLSVTRASDLADGVRARMEEQGLEAEITADALLLSCDGFEMIALLAGLTEAMAQGGVARAFDLRITEDGSGALIRLAWQGAALPVAQLERWLEAPLEAGLPGVSRRSVLAGHGTEVWPEPVGPGVHSLCLPVPQARRVVRRPVPVARPVVYDFDLLSKARGAAVEESRLADLTYVVFDTETTGLAPDKDEIVQIAALRIVNGRRVEGEVFNTLVNPRRKIPAGSTEVHGITDAMVQDAPQIEEVAARFHKFAEGAVLVAHNAPFDMAFLRRAEATTGLRFDNPVLDTVLLSAVVFGQHEVHSLDALTHRLGITIPEEARHTAIGDTIATAEAFLKLLAMVQGRGLASFGAVLAEVRRHGRLLKDLN